MIATAGSQENFLDDLEVSGHPIRLAPGPYYGYRNDDPNSFVVEVDAQPLAVLCEAAKSGLRVYELMTVTRPGDIFNYLRLLPIDTSRGVNETINQRRTLCWNVNQRDSWGEGYFPLTVFDAIFNESGDDTTPEAKCWLAFRRQSSWNAAATRLLGHVLNLQNALRSSTDGLTRSEIERMDGKTHRRDFFANIDRQCIAIQNDPPAIGLPDCVHEVIADLITRDTVQSVSAPYKDFRLWHVLCEQQLHRAETTGYPPDEAFTLTGPDSGLSHVPYENWGADVHIPYEGTCFADLFIKPDWRAVFPDHDEAGGHLVQVFNFEGYNPSRGFVCHYVLTPSDLGELACASRLEVGEGWVLYQSKLPYEPNPRRKPHLLKRDNRDASS